MSGEELTEVAVATLFDGGSRFRPDKRYAHLQLVAYALGVTMAWTFKRGINVAVESHGQRTFGSDPDWEVGYGEGNELGLHVLLTHWTKINESRAIAAVPPRTALCPRCFVYCRPDCGTSDQ